MRWYLPLLALAVVALAVPPPARAINLFGRRARANPAERVPELINTIRTAPEERKRSAAVEELRQYDAAAYPQIVPVLADALKGDSSAAVRAEAAHSLGRLRPATSAAAEALEAATHDAALRVRWQARSALMFYPSAATRQTVKGREQAPPARPVVVERPPAAGGSTVPADPLLLPVPAGPTVAAPGTGTAEPPRVAPAGIARPLPRGPEAVPVPPPQGTAQPTSTEPPRSTPAPGDGPELTPPQ
jgi:hypothetical protein